MAAATLRSLPGVLSAGDLLGVAIRERRLISFVLHGLPRRAEPHEYGIIGGEPLLRFYQVAGQSRSGRFGWRTARLSDVSELLLLDIRFNLPRDSGPTGPLQWDRLFASVSRAADADPGDGI